MQFYLKRALNIDDMSFVKNRLLILTLGAFAWTACNSPSSVQETSTVIPPVVSTAIRFAAGSKAVKINTHINGSSSTVAGTTSSFFTPTSLPPSSTPIPPTFPGYDGSTTYHAGVPAQQFFDVDGTTIIQKPTWLQDFQLGITGVSAGVGACATFGGAGTSDVSGYYRTSEAECAHSGDSGNGLNSDNVFMRFVLNRDNTILGSGENLMIQIEYQASGIRLNSDGVSTNPESNVDQLWKIFWNSSLSAASASNVFSVFVPPNQAACLNDGSGTTGIAGSNCALSGYKGAPISTKQIIIPLSAYPSMSVIQISRMAGRTNSTDTFPDASLVDYVNSFCTVADSPLCLGVVVRSVTLMRL